MEQQIARKEHRRVPSACARESASRHRLLWNAPSSPGQFGSHKGPKGPTHATNNTREPRRVPAALSDLQSFFVEDASAHRVLSATDAPWGAPASRRPLSRNAPHTSCNG